MTDTPPRLSEDRNWIATTGIDRRRLIAGSVLAAGFAAACQPIAATTKQTSAAGIDQGPGHFPAADGFSVPLFFARPQGSAPAPVVIVVHEIFGVHEWIRDICRRLAKAGYLAVAPDLFARHGDATRISDIPTLIQTIVSKAPDMQVMTDIDAAYAWAGANGGDAKRRGITGFCWGGRIVWLYAAHSRALDAGVAYYGRLTGDATALQPQRPIDRVEHLNAPVLGQYGGKDRGIPVADVEAMRERLAASGKGPPSAITLYPDAEHGFMADYRPSYDEAAARAAWAATLSWFGTYLKDQG